MGHTEHQGGIATASRLRLILGIPLLLGPLAFEPLLGTLVELALEGRLLIICQAPGGGSK